MKTIKFYFTSVICLLIACVFLLISNLYFGTKSSTDAIFFLLSFPMYVLAAIFFILGWVENDIPRK